MLIIFRINRSAYDDDEYEQERRPYKQGYSNQRYSNQNYSNQGYSNQGYSNQGYSRSPYGQQGYGQQGGFGWGRNNNQIGETLRKPNWDNSKLTPFAKDFYDPHPDVVNRSNEEVEEYYESKEITVSKNAPKPILSFEEANFPEYVMKEVR